MRRMDLVKRAFRPVFDRQTYLDASYLVVGFPSAIVWFVVMVTLYALGMGLAVVWVGVGILVGAQALLRPIGAIERAQVRKLLGSDVPAPPPLDRGPTAASRTFGWSSVRATSVALVHDRHSWRVLAWVVLRLAIAPVGLAVAIAAFATGITIVVAPIGAWAVKGLGDLHRFAAERWLGPCGDEERRAALARAARAEEQVRIDQELHDSIGHMVSMIVVQAGAGAHVFDTDPVFSRRALRTIEDRGRAALGELDRLIARIRGDETEAHAPLPGAADLPALVASARDAGVDVTADLTLDGIPSAIGRGAYRVVQEALTNAAKHAPGESVTIAIASDDDVVAIAVRNPVAREADLRDGGNGLASIRDRVALLGGHATVGLDGSGGFVVRAALPVGMMLAASDDVDCRLTSRCRCPVCRLTGRVRT